MHESLLALSRDVRIQEKVPRQANFAVTYGTVLALGWRYIRQKRPEWLSRVDFHQGG
jgi:hypothetical protein